MFDWLWLVIVLIVGLVLLGVVYFLGDVYYNVYLVKFLIEFIVFLIDKVWYFVLLLYGVLNMVVNVQVWFIENMVLILKFVVMILFGVVVWVLIEKGLFWVVECVSRWVDGMIRFIKFWLIVV